MKISTILYVFLLVCLTFFACTKVKVDTNSRPVPGVLFFEIADKEGKSLITSLKDSVKVNYTENGTTKSYNLLIFKLYAPSANGVLDTTKLSSNYNGLYLQDNFMGILSGREANPIRNFSININGKNVGAVYLNYWEGPFTFNNKPIERITTETMPLSLLKIQ